MKYLLTLILLSLAMLTLALSSPTTEAASKERKPTKEYKFFGRKIQKTIDREGGGEVTYPGIVIHTRKKNATEAVAYLADCDAGQICSGRCYYDQAWLYVSPGTFGQQIFDKICSDNEPE